MYQLYYYPNTASLAPHFLLNHMNLEYELILVDKKSNAHKAADYLTLNPAGRIPTLIFDNQPLFESPAICLHLCESHPEHGLIPLLGDPLRPLFFQWLTYLNNTLQAELMVYYYPHRHTNNTNGIAAVKAAQEQCISAALSVLNDQLADRQYLLGEQLTACDYFLFMLCEWSLPVKSSPLTFSHLAAYLKRLSTLPSIVKVCDIEGIDLNPFSSYPITTADHS